MPKIKFVRLHCHCGATYDVRLSRIEDGTPFECVSCGHNVATQEHQGVLKLIHRYSEIVCDLERQFACIDGETLVLKPRVGTAVAGGSLPAAEGLGHLRPDR